MLITFQVHNASHEFIETSTEIDPSLPTKIWSKKLAKTDLTSCEEYKAYKKKHCLKGEYAFHVLNIFPG